MTVNPRTDYILGSTDAEHERLIYQARRLAPMTEAFFREAGIGPGQRVLDLGSGVGDVAMLAARLVGPSGTVVAIERDTRSVNRARTRAAEAGLDNVTFIETDIAHLTSGEKFDAAVGRFILQFLPDPVATLRSLADNVKLGGSIAFQEPSWAPFLAFCRDLPLCSACAQLMYEVAERRGVHMNMGRDLFKAFRDAGLPAPRMRLEMELGHEAEFTRWISDAFSSSVRPQVQKLNLAVEGIGDLDTLEKRVRAEVAAANTVAPWLAVVSAWTRTHSDAEPLYFPVPLPHSQA